MRFSSYIRLLLSCLLVTPLVGACPEPSPVAAPDTADAGPEVAADARVWRSILHDSAAPIHAVWEDSNGAIWAVGASRDSIGGLVLRASPGASSWERLATGLRHDLWAVADTPASQTVYIAGSDGLLLSHASNGPQSFQRLHTGTTADLYGIWASETHDEVWVVGGHQNPPADGPSAAMMRIRFGVLEAIPVPAALPLTERLQDVWASAPNDVFAVGDQGSVIRFDGTQWTHTQLPGNPRLVAIGGNNEATYAVGGRNSAQAWRLTSAGQWSDDSPAGLPLMTGIHMATSGAAAAVGVLGVVRELRNGAWYDLPFADVLRDWRAVHIDRAGDIWVGGGHLLTSSPGGGTLLRLGSARSDAPTLPWALTDAVIADAPDYDASDGDADVDGDNGPGPADGGPMDVSQPQVGAFLVEMGAGSLVNDSAFVPIGTGAPLEIVQGFQGGIHLEIRLRVVIPGASAPAGRVVGDVAANTVAGGVQVGTFAVNNYPLEKVQGAVDTFQSPTIPVFFASSTAATYQGLSATVTASFTHLGKTGQQVVSVLLIDAEN